MEQERFFYSNGHKIYGTLTLPDKIEKAHACLFIGGSRPQTRDGNMDNSKTDWYPVPIPDRNLFVDEAEILLELGIASFRYDKRGCGKSEGNFNRTGYIDLIIDARNALQWMKTIPGIDSTSIGILGQSEGAYIALLLASEDLDVAFCIRHGGPFRNLKDIGEWQVNNFWNSGDEAISKMKQISPWYYWVCKEFDKINEAIDQNEMFYNLGDENWSFKLYLPWLRESYANFDRNIVNSVTCPILILHGNLDKSIPLSDAHELEKALISAGNTKIVKYIFLGLDHSFRRLNNPNESTMSAMSRPLDPEVPKVLKNWLKTVISI